MLKFSLPDFQDLLQCILVTQWYLTLCNPMECSLPGSSVDGKKIEGGIHFLLQGIFPTQRANPGLLHCRQILYISVTREVHYKAEIPSFSVTCPWTHNRTEVPRVPKSWKTWVKGGEGRRAIIIMNLHCLNQIVYMLLIQLLQWISKGNTYIFCFSGERIELHLRYLLKYYKN